MLHILYQSHCSYGSKLTYSLATAFICMLVSGCSLTMPAECKKFYALPPQEQEVIFRTYPVEKQLDIYHCGMRAVYPPDITLAWEIASGGENNIPFLLERLKAERNISNQEDIIYVFQVMSKKGYLNCRRDVLNELKQVVSAMKYDDVRARNEQRLQEIEGHLEECPS
jgi:hypothetical protein